MDEDKLKKIVEAVVDPLKKQLDEVSLRLDDPETGLRRISEKLDVNTESVVSIEPPPEFVLADVS